MAGPLNTQGRSQPTTGRCNAQSICCGNCLQWTDSSCDVFPACHGAMWEFLRRITISLTQASLLSVAEVTKLLQRICQATARTCLCL